MLTSKQHTCSASVNLETEMSSLWQAEILFVNILSCSIPHPLLSQIPINITLKYLTANRLTEEILLSNTNIWLFSRFMVHIKFSCQSIFEAAASYLQNFKTVFKINNPMADIKRIIKLPQSNEHYIQRFTHKYFTICLLLVFKPLLVSISPKREMS